MDPASPKLTTPQILKLFTQVPRDFIDDFFSLYDPKKLIENPYIIDLDKLAKWLVVEKKRLLSTLRASYKEGTHYVKVKGPPPKGSSNRYQRVMITPETMKRMCMRSKSEKSETVRTYFIEIEQFILHYNDEIVDGLMRSIHEDARKNLAQRTKDGPGSVYVLRAAEDPTDFLVKFGETGQKIEDRLKAYNTGRATDAELLYIYKTPYRKEVERCVKKLMAAQRYKPHRELYKVDLEIIAKLISGCATMSLKLRYAKRVSRMTGDYYIIFTSDLEEAA
jgi:phage anti-repressor protein